MRTTEELNKLSAKVGIAERAYRNAVKENLKELGKEVKVATFDDDSDINGYCVDVPNSWGEGIERYHVDKVRYNSEQDCIECHVVALDYEKQDYWLEDWYFEGEIDYILDNIIWEE